MSKESKIILLVAAVVIAGIAILIGFVNSKQLDPAGIMEKIVREDSRTYGTGDVYLVEFGDYQCPACASVNPDIEKLKEEYKDTMTFVYRNFPLPGHANAQAAAEAAEAAASQGKFWEMHTLLFEKQNEWSALADPNSLFTQYAESLGLDKEQFADDITGKANKDRISSDQSDGYAVGVSGTPTFFVNGKKLNSIDYDSIKKAIDLELGN